MNVKGFVMYACMRTSDFELCICVLFCAGGKDVTKGPRIFDQHPYHKTCVDALQNHLAQEQVDSVKTGVP